MSKEKAFIESLIAPADIKLNGSRPWDITVHNEDLYKRVLSQGSLGFGESYMDGWWDCDALDDMLTRVFQAGIEKKVGKLRVAAHVLRAKVSNQQNKKKAFEVGEVHYDVGNDLYERMLDKRMTYTCGYWKDAQTLDEAQEAKLDLVCKKIGLKAGDHVLDIGCGWGSFATFAAEKYGAKVTGVNNSKQQTLLANNRYKDLDVSIEVKDYRDITGQYDHVVSLGMFEHVGYKNYRTYFEVAERCLKDGGLFLLHTIGGSKTVKATDPWIDKYIFPNSMLPSVSQIARGSEGLFVMEDWHNFGAYYDTTLLAWMKNADDNWRELKDTYGDRFYRMWRFYLLSSAATFRSRKNHLWQIVFSKRGVPGGYTSIR